MSAGPPLRDLSSTWGQNWGEAYGPEQPMVAEAPRDPAGPLPRPQMEGAESWPGIVAVDQQAPSSDALDSASGIVTP